MKLTNKRPEAVLEADWENEEYKLLTKDPIIGTDDPDRQLIATIYDHEEAHTILDLWNSNN